MKKNILENAGHGSLGHRIFCILRDKILNEEYEKGQKLNEVVLSKELNISRTPIREALKQLDDHAQKEIKRINELCNQFIEARVYVIAAPMWNLSFPPQLKEYFDCIIQDKKTIKFENKKPKGTLNDFDRSLVYIQSSGGKIPFYIRPVLNKGLNYIKYICKFLGIKKRKEILVDNTGTTQEEKQQAIENGISQIDKVLKSLKF